MERQYDEIMRLLKNVIKDLTQLKNVMSRGPEHEITKEEQNELDQTLLQLEKTMIDLGEGI